MIWYLYFSITAASAAQWYAARVRRRSSCCAVRATSRCACACSATTSSRASARGRRCSRSSRPHSPHVRSPPCLVVGPWQHWVGTSWVLLRNTHSFSLYHPLSVESASHTWYTKIVNKKVIFQRLTNVFVLIFSEICGGWLGRVRGRLVRGRRWQRWRWWARQAWGNTWWGNIYCCTQAYGSRLRISPSYNLIVISDWGI